MADRAPSPLTDTPIGRVIRASHKRVAEIPIVDASPELQAAYQSDVEGIYQVVNASIARSWELPMNQAQIRAEPYADSGLAWVFLPEMLQTLTHVEAVVRYLRQNYAYARYGAHLSPKEYHPDRLPALLEYHFSSAEPDARFSFAVRRLNARLTKHVASITPESARQRPRSLWSRRVAPRAMATLPLKAVGISDRGVSELFELGITRLNDLFRNPLKLPSRNELSALVSDSDWKTITELWKNPYYASFLGGMDDQLILVDREPESMWNEKVLNAVVDSTIQQGDLSMYANVPKHVALADRRLIQYQDLLPVRHRIPGLHLESIGHALVQAGMYQIKDALRYSPRQLGAALDPINLKAAPWLQHCCAHLGLAFAKQDYIEPEDSLVNDPVTSSLTRARLAVLEGIYRARDLDGLRLDDLSHCIDDKSAHVDTLALRCFAERFGYSLEASQIQGRRLLTP